LLAGPYDKPLKRFADCLDGFEKDRQYTTYAAAKQCGVHPETVESYVYQNLNELNKEMIARGKKVRPESVTKEVRGLVVDPPQPVGVLALLIGMSMIVICSILLANCSMFRCDGCGVQIDLKGWNQPSFACPKCGKVFVRLVDGFVQK
jgi:hypothetical protein